MAVRAVGAERHADVGANPSKVSGDASDGVARVRPVELLVPVSEQRDLADAERGGGGAQLGLADAAQSRRSRMAIVAGTEATIPAAVAPSGGEQKDVHTFGAVFRERA